jgi:AbrB family looped-hinge helix DNA binding protein
MTGRIGAKGQVVIPKTLRDRANLHPGDEVDFEFRDEEIVLVARRQPSRLGGRFADSGMAARLSSRSTTGLSATTGAQPQTRR